MRNFVIIMKFCQNCEILSKLWSSVKIVKFCQNCEILSKLWNFVNIVKFYQNCEILSKLWNSVKIVKSKHLKGCSVPRVSNGNLFTRDFKVFLFLDTFRIQRIWHILMFLDTLCIFLTKSLENNDFFKEFCRRRGVCNWIRATI